MHLLGITEEQLPIGSEGLKSVQLEHELRFQGCGELAMMRKCSALHQKQVPTGNPCCPGGAKLAKRIMRLTGNKAAWGDVEEESKLEGVGLGEIGTNPIPSHSANPSSSPNPEAGNTVTPLARQPRAKLSACRELDLAVTSGFCWHISFCTPAHKQEPIARIL